MGGCSVWKMDGEYRINMDIHEIRLTDDVAASKGHTGTSRDMLIFLSDEDKKLLKRELNVEKNHTIGEIDQSEITVTKIQRVPETLRVIEKFEEYYKPRKLAIGPIHATDSDLSKSNYIKIKLAAKLIKDNGQTWESLLEVVKKDIQKLKNCFDHQVITKYDNDSLASLLLLDGCAVLQFIHSFIDSRNELRELESPNEFKELEISNDDVALIEQDLFLLENQIPYYLLKRLMAQLKVADPIKEHSTAIKILVARSNIIAPIIGYWATLFTLNIKSITDRLSEGELPVHLLDLLLWILVGHNKDEGKPNDDTSNFLSCIPSFGRDNQNGTGNAFEDMLNSLAKMHGHDGLRYSFRNVQELKSAGIELKSKDSCSLRSVSFNQRFFTLRGDLKIPSLIVENSTIPKLMNLVAFERCLDKDYVVTSYVKLLDSLIDTEQDVIELKRANVLQHRLGSNKELALLFDGIGSNILLLPEHDVYDKVTRRVDSHCQRMWPIWIEQFRRDHCSSPWTILAYVFAIIGVYMSLRGFFDAIFPEEGALVNGIADFYKSA